VHQCQRARHDGAAGLARVEELLLVDLLGAGVVADEDHLGALVVALQEQIEQQKEALGDLLHVLVHRTGDIHQAEHHRLGAGLRLFGVEVVAQVVAVEKRNLLQPRLQLGDLLVQFTDAPLEQGGLRRAQQRLTRVEQLLQLCPQWCADGDAPRQRRAHRAHDVELGRTAIADHAGPAQLEAVDPGQMAFDQIGQRQILEQEFEKLIARDRE
jgi:hypothetical protein